MATYLRGQIAKASGVHPETLRYYERMALIPPPERTDGGYRVYPEETLQRLAFIQYAKEAGFTLEEIRQIFGAIDRRAADMPYIKDLITSKLHEIGSKIQHLASMQNLLGNVLDHLDKPDKCPVLQSFFDKLEL